MILGTSTNRKALLKGTAGALALALAAPLLGAPALAGGFAVREQSVAGQGSSFAGVAAGGGGLGSMFWNPATITQNPGFRNSANGSLILPQADIRTDPVLTSPFLTPGGDSGNIGIAALVPATYASYQVNDRLWVGFAGTSPFGLVTKPNDIYAGQFQGRSSKLFTINFSPTIGFKVTDWLSLGAGLMVEYADAKLKQAAPVPALFAAGPAALLTRSPSVTLQGDDIGLGFTLGALLTPLQGTEIGVGFRSSIHHELEGQLITPTAVLPIRAKLNLPETVTVGLRQAIGPSFNLLAGYEFANWSRLGTVNIQDRISGLSDSSIPFQYKDGHFFSLGGEYKLRPDLTLRAGAAYEISPVSDRVRNVRIPDDDRIWASAGATYQITSQLSADFAYTHIFGPRDTRINITAASGSPYYQGTPLLNYAAKVESSVNIVSVALNYRFDHAEPARAVAPAPIVRKY